MCAAKDSRPLLKAKDPMGSAESESKRRKWVDEEADGDGAGRTGFESHE